MPESSPRDILVLAAHPDLARSQVTQTLLRALRASPAAARVELRDLYRTAWELPQKALIDMAAARAR